MERRRTFTREFKFEAVKLVTERGVSAAQAAKDLDVHENVLRRWVRELREAPQEAFPGNGKQTAQDAEIARLRRGSGQAQDGARHLEKSRGYFAKVVGNRTVLAPVPTSPTSGRPKAGCTWQRCWTFTRVASWAGRRKRA